MTWLFRESTSAYASSASSRATRSCPRSFEMTSPSSNETFCAPKLRVNKRDQLLEGRIVALTPGEKEAGHLNGMDSARILSVKF